MPPKDPNPSHPDVDLVRSSHAGNGPVSQPVRRTLFSPAGCPYAVPLRPLILVVDKEMLHD